MSSKLSPELAPLNDSKSKGDLPAFIAASVGSATTNSLGS